jgi:Rrf2 family iron-sulfur cluster assembly transcriptional regulator
MRLTTKGRFAVTAMIDLALRQGNGPVTLSGISQRQAISLSYLEQLFGKLRRHEIVESVRGPGGGYSLARTADKVTVADIIIAVDEPLDATMVDYLDSVTLQDLVEQQKQKEQKEQNVVVMHRHAPAENTEATHSILNGVN